MNDHTVSPNIPNNSWSIDLSHLLGSAPAVAVDFKKAAELTSLSVNTLRRLASTGTLRTTLVGRRRIVPVQALIDLVAKGVPSERR